MSRARVVIAEDEDVARAALRRMVCETEWVELVGEAGDGKTALDIIERLQPDLLFLDVMLPELTGLQVLDRLEHKPLVVFTTAYEKYAVKAFEFEAIDYLVKPFGPRRFGETMERVRRRLETGGAAPLVRLFARIGDRIVPVPVREVSRFQAEGDYVRAHLPRGSHLLYVTLTDLEQQLDGAMFVRIHRSHIVNADCIRNIERHDDHRYRVVLKDGTEIVASRAASQDLRRLVR